MSAAHALARGLQMDRFQRAILNARELPPDLLTNSQKLKLYALYKQTESPAPPEPPPRVNALARAKVCPLASLRPRSPSCSRRPRPLHSGRLGTTCAA